MGVRASLGRNGWYWIICLLLFSRCNSRQSAPAETISSGRINISVDETFKPVIDSQIRVFEALYPDASVIAHYKAEADCMKDLLNDSIRMVIVARGLSSSEEKFMKDTLQFAPGQNKIAYDAITVVVNNTSKDTLFDMMDLRFLVKGAGKYKVVLDGLNATSTVRYVMDSLLKGAPFGPNVVAAKSSQGVIDYVADHPDAIGLVGVSWIGNQDDADQMSFTGKVKIAAIKCKRCNPVTYVKPYQSEIGLNRYPMVRSLFYILKENYSGLGSGFADFLVYEKGQLIFRRAYLWPAQMSFGIRDINIKPT